MSIKERFINWLAKELDKRKIEIPIVIEEGGIAPSKETEGSAAYDLFAPCDVNMKDGRFVVPLNIRFALPKGYVAIVKPRSGLTLKGFLVEDVYGNRRRVNADAKDGVIDSDYRGIVGVLMHSHTDIGIIKRGDGIAQLLIMKAERVNWVLSKSLDNTHRGEKGFGS